MIVFIIGCARSGTSILGELMGAHHQALYIGEQMQPVWHGMSAVSHHRMTRDDVTPKCKAIVKKFFDDIDDRSDLPNHQILIEKTPPNILRTMFIYGILPEAKFIHIIRDGRDVACSLVPGLTDSWQHLKPPGWQNTEAVYELLRRGAWLWNNALYFGLSDLHRINHLQIRYEDLIYDPVGIAKRIFTYLEMTIDPNVVDFSAKIQNETKGSYHALGQSHWFRNDHKHRIGRWKENIPKDQLAGIEGICSPILEQLGYK